MKQKGRLKACASLCLLKQSVTPKKYTGKVKMRVSKVIGKIVLTQKHYEDLANLGTNYIASDNPLNRGDTEEIVNRINNAEAIIINISIHITKEVIARCKNLRFIQTWSTGVDNIDMNAAKDAGIIVKSVPDYSIESVAEKTIGLMIFTANQMREANIDALAGNWNYTKFRGLELRGKTLGIIGNGKIGSRVAELASAFGMTIISANSKTSKEQIKEICSLSDFITLHCPLNKNTYHLLDEDAFQIMKKGIYLINTSRGGLIDENALLKALNKNIVSYACLDVFEQEPPDKSNPLLYHPNVFVTPHSAWHTKESVQRLTDHSIANLKEYIINSN